jgi:hypothetical protein
MSDQIFFTKEEVEKIKEALQINRDDLSGERHMSLTGELQYTTEALTLISSPRPISKNVLSMSMLCEICDTSDRMENDNNNWGRSNFVLAFRAIANKYGFDVED